MFTIQVSPQSHVRQIDDFPAECARSLKGAVHFHPGAVKELTPGEWEHIQKAHPDFAGDCTVLVAHKEASAPTPPPAPDVVAAEDPKPAKPARR